MGAHFALVDPLKASSDERSPFGLPYARKARVSEFMIV
jgi:hypothetical protein